jgi:hypothetical protein
MIEGRNFVFESRTKEGPTLTSEHWNLHFPYKSQWAIMSLPEYIGLVKFEQLAVDLASNWLGRRILKWAGLRFKEYPEGYEKNSPK